MEETAMRTEQMVQGMTCDMCSTRLDLAGETGDVAQVARRRGWVSVAGAGQDVCPACLSSDAGQRYLTRLQQGEPGPKIAPSENPQSEPAEIIPSGEPVPGGDTEERQNTDEPAPGEPRENPDSEQEGRHSAARLEGAAV
jgi:hypothetical protein